MSVLSEEKVNAVFMDCLFRDGEDTSNHVKAEGVAHNVGFNPTRLEVHRPEIDAMLDELPDQFHEKRGGGWSFLNSCNDKHGKQWTGLHLRMEQLFQLGIGIGRVESPLPRELWGALPGGVHTIQSRRRRMGRRLDPDERHQAELRRREHKSSAPQREEKRQTSIRLLRQVRAEIIKLIEERPRNAPAKGTEAQ